MKKVAIIEDNAEINNLVYKILCTENYELSQFFNGQDVMNQIDEIVEHDVIVLDVMLPGVDGLAIYKAIKDQFPQAEEKILFLTAKSDKQTLKFFSENKCHYITKPFDPYDFLNQIKKLIVL